MKAPLAIVIAAAAAATVNADIIIDDFSNAFASEEFVGSSANYEIFSTYDASGLEIGNLALTNGAGIGDTFAYTPRAMEAQFQTGLSAVFGGSRNAVLQAGDPSVLGSRVSVNAFSYQGNSGLSFSTAFGTQGILDLTYDASGNGLNLDASAQGGAINISLLTGDLHIEGYDQYDRPVPLTVTLTSGLGTAMEASFSTSLNLLYEGDNLFDLADYANAGVDLTDLDVLKINIDQSAPELAAADFAIGPIQILGVEGGNVPAPGALALLGLSVATTSRRRR